MDEETRLRIESLEGQVAAAGLVVNALIGEHPYPTELIATIQQRFERMQSRLLASHVPDEVIGSAHRWMHMWVTPQHGSNDRST